MKIDFIRLLKDFKIDFDSNAEWVNINCPFCKNDSGKHGGINLAGEYFNCFKCGQHNIKKTLQLALGIPYFQLDTILESYLSAFGTTRKKATKKTANASMISLPIDELNSMASKYLLKRNFDPEYLNKKYGVVGINIAGPWAYRIIIPIYFNNRLVSFQGRSIFSKRKCKELKILRYKTLSVPESIIDPKDILYNLDNCRKDSVIVTEGAPDVWNLGDDTVATLGTGMTDAQLNLLREKFKTVTFLFDPDPEAQKRAIEQATRLAMVGIKNVFVIDTQLKHDPGDMTEKEKKQLKAELLK